MPGWGWFLIGLPLGAFAGVCGLLAYQREPVDPPTGT
jgi:hypothetical protein